MLYIMRHGQTDWNRRRRIQGSTEWTDLSDEGVHDAEMVRDGLLDLSMHGALDLAVLLRQALAGAVFSQLIVQIVPVLRIGCVSVSHTLEDRILFNSLRPFREAFVGQLVAHPGR